MEAIEIIRVVGAEFKDTSNEDLEKWIEIFRPMVSRKQFGKLYEQALAFLVCHKLKMAGNGDNPLGDMGGIGMGLTASSVSEGGSTISYGSGLAANLVTDAELGLTTYGLQFLALKRMCVVPIHVSGEVET